MSKEISIKLSAKDGISKVFAHITKSTKSLETSQNELRKQLSNIKAFESLKKSTAKIKQSTEKYRTAQTKLQEKLKSGVRLTTSQQQRLKELTQKVAANNSTLAKSTRELKQRNIALKKAGINTKNLAADQTRLTQKLRETGAKLRAQQNKKSQKNGGSRNLPTAGGIFAAFYGAKKYYDFLKNYADSADSINKTSAKLGISSTALQAYRHQANLSGTDTESFDKAMEGMSRRLGEMKVGTGSLTTFLNKSDQGFLQTLKTTNGNEKAFELLSEKIGNMKDPMKQAALANAAFGKSGYKMLLMLKEGSAGLIESKEKLKNLGGGITKEEAKTAEDFNDRLGELAQIFEVIKARALTPILKTITKAMQSFLEKIRLGGSEYIQQIAQKFTQVGERIWEVLKFFGKFFIFLSDLQEKVGIINALVASFLAFKIVLFAIAAAWGLNPLGLMVTALQAVAAAIFLIYNNWEKVKKSLKPVSGWITSGQNKAKLGGWGSDEATTIPKFLKEKEAIALLQGKLAKKEKAVIDVNFTNAPVGTTTTQQAIGLQLNTGMFYQNYAR